MIDRDVVRVNCQFCKTPLGIPVEQVTDRGRSIVCPRCHQSFIVKKSQFERHFTYSMHCPKCGEFQEASDECIYCNIIISKFVRINRLRSAWDVLSERFNVITGVQGALNSARELTVKCPGCGFSRGLSRAECPAYITRIGCPNCNQSFDITNWIR